METLLAVGTMKGLFRFSSRDDGATWKLAGVDFKEEPVYTALYDDRTGTLIASPQSFFYGAQIARSRDLGKTWDTSATPPAYAEDDAEKVTRLWSLAKGPENDPDVLYAGVEASGLFRSGDGGSTWQEVSSLRAHPTHDTWQSGFGGKCLHTIVLDPNHAGRMFIACSTGGLYRSDDAGETWVPKNKGVRVDFFPEGQSFPESGQCVHKVAPSPSLPGRMWMQNHGGVYRSDDSGDSWQDVGAGLPSDFGFGIVTHPSKPDTALVIPLAAGEFARWGPDAHLTVWRTDDGGKTWTERSAGLPYPAYVGVLRDAFRGWGSEARHLALGTTSGGLYTSTDEGATWSEVAQHLPRILFVGAWSVAR